MDAEHKHGGKGPTIAMPYAQAIPKKIDMGRLLSRNLGKELMRAGGVSRRFSQHASARTVRRCALSS